MRISKKVGLIIGAVILVVILVILFSTYSRQAGERNDLNARLSAAQTLLPILTTQKTDLENQLAQIESSLNANKAKFPESVESIEYGEDFFNVAIGEIHSSATGCGVELTSLTASEPTARTVGTVIYCVSAFTVVVDGEVSNVLDFIDAIGTGIDYQLSWSFQVPWSVDVKSVDLTLGGGTAKASINLDIYGYKG